MKGFTFNKNKKVILKMVEKTIDNDGYCLCQFPKSDETLCPCDNFINNKECICNMFVKEQNEDKIIQPK